MIDSPSVFLLKARASLAGAESEFASGRYDNSASRAYYACFQAALHALILAGIRPPGSSRSGQWSHAFVPSQFDGQLIERRRMFPPILRGVLARNYDLRRRADYTDNTVSQTEMGRALRRTQLFVQAIQETRGAV